MKAKASIRICLRGIVTALLVAGCCFPALAGDVKRQFRHWGAGDGLSNSTVTCFLRGQDGCLWIGTESGLNRYDGSRFRMYRDGELENSAVWTMQEDATGDVWIEHSGGWEYARYDHAKDAVDGDVDGFLKKRLGISVEGKRKIFVDRAGDIWVLT